MKKDKVLFYSIECVFILILIFTLFVKNIYNKVLLSIIMVVYYIIVNKLLKKRVRISLSNAIQGRNFSFSVFGNGFFTQSGQAGSINDSYESKINDSNYNNYRGFLMEKGNNVYVDSGSSIFEQAGAQELIKQIIIDGFWNVVGNRRKAHFVIKYTSESSNDNRELARDVYLKNIVPLQKKIEAKKYPKKLLQFTR